MAGSGCRSPMSICALRLTRLNSNGSPVGGNTAGAVSLVGGVGSLKWTSVFVTGDDIAEPDGCGGLAVVRKYPDRLKRQDLELDFLVKSYELQELAYDAQLITHAATVVGAADIVDTACGAGTTHNGVIVEAWGENWECNQTDGTYPYHRRVFARAFFTPSDGTMQRGANHLILKGFAQPNSNFGNGPFNDLADLQNISNWVGATIEDTALPTASVDCGYVTTPSQS